MTAHAESGKAFQKIPAFGIDPVAWDDATEIRGIQALLLEALRERFCQAKVVHTWRNSWGGMTHLKL